MGLISADCWRTCLPFHVTLVPTLIQLMWVKQWISPMNRILGLCLLTPHLPSKLILVAVICKVQLAYWPLLSLEREDTRHLFDLSEAEKEQHPLDGSWCWKCKDRQAHIFFLFLVSCYKFAPIFPTVTTKAILDPLCPWDLYISFPAWTALIICHKYCIVLCFQVTRNTVDKRGRTIR